MKSITVPFLFCLLRVHVNAQWDNWTNRGSVFDLNLYKSGLDHAMCRKQIDYMLHENTLLLAEFLDAGLRQPAGIFTGNFVDLGNYYQCLGIHEPTKNFVVDGKYCVIDVPLDQSKFKLPSFLSLPRLPRLPDLSKDMFNLPAIRKYGNLTDLLKKYGNIRKGIEMKTDGNKTLDSALSGMSFTLGVCIPKVCTAQQALDALSYNLAPGTGFQFKEKYCRLPNDKTWVTVDYVALVVFSTIGLLTLLSTAYDIYQTIYLEIDSNQGNRIYQSFSVYTNTLRLVTYNPVPGTLECLDGIRSLAMIWVVIGHTFAINMMFYVANPLDIYEFASSLKSIWLLSAPLTVDTFFMLSGLLLMYTTTCKFTRRKLVSNLHLFYLLRVLRMFPVLAAVILLQASLLNHVADGPNWNVAGAGVSMCRENWWITLLYVQNYIKPRNMCLPHTWYLAIDVQLHFLSPLVLFWILGREKKTAWLALAVTIILALGPASIYNTLMEFPGVPGALSNLENSKRYMLNYYINTLTRCPPYIVGMIYGYSLHLYRDKQVVMPQLLVTFLWACATVLFGFIIYTSHTMTQLDWDNKLIDTIACSLMRPAWAAVIGWLVFACVQGYGGPVNWVLSLRIWKLLSRLSYAMYIVHYVIIVTMYSSTIAPVDFSPQFYVTRFMSDFLLTAFAAFLLTVLIDAPCSVLIKYFIGEDPKKELKADDGKQPKIEVHPDPSVDVKNNFKYTTPNE